MFTFCCAFNRNSGSLSRRFNNKPSFKYHTRKRPFGNFHQNSHNVKAGFNFVPKLNNDKGLQNRSNASEPEQKERKPINDPRTDPFRTVASRDGAKMSSPYFKKPAEQSANCPVPFKRPMGTVRQQNKPLHEVPVKSNLVNVYESVDLRHNLMDLDDNLDNYITTPISIPYARIKEFKTIKSRMFFEVEVVKVTSPSLFIFQYHKTELINMMNKMK